MANTSKDLIQFADMYDAIKRGMSNNSNPLDFIAELHESGFMVVPEDAVMIDPMAADVPVDDGVPKATQPAAALNPPPRPSLEDENPF